MQPRGAAPASVQVPSPRQPAGAARPAAARIRGRALAIGVVALWVNQMWLVQVELVRWSLFTNLVPFCNAIFTLTIVLGLNALTCRISRRREPLLHRGELLCVFTMTCIGSALGAQQFGQLLVSFLPYPFQYAGVGNLWPSTFMPFLPRHLMVSDPTAVRGFYSGNTSLYRPENWIPWVAPCLFWVAFLLVLLWTMLCANTLLRRRWTLSERLTYPTVLLPLEMTSGTPFWRNRVMWAGFALAGGVTFLNGLAYLAPSLPSLPIKRQDVTYLLTTPPWNGIGSLQTSFYFFAIGISFLMPRDLSFSLWFFYLIFKLELVTVTALGMQQTFSSGTGFDNSPPYENGQAYGAYMAVFAMATWSARGYLRELWLTAFGRGPRPLDDSGEPMRYRTAILGGGAGVVALAAMCAAIGMSPGVAAAFLVLYLMLSIVIARIRAEFGFPVHDMHFMGPANPLLASMGTTAVGPRGMAAFALTYWFNRTYFAHPMPHQLEGMKLAESSATAQRDLLRAMLVAGAVGAVGLFWSYLHVAYDLGAGTARVERWPRSFPLENFDRLNSWFQAPGVTNARSLTAALVGFLLALTLGALRQRLAWFPFHPLGYAVANSWGMTQIWLPVLIGSVLKILSMKYGGLALYRRAVPFFFGLILGEMIVGCLWTLYGVALGIRAYEFWP
ncbi:MAG: hypothetical protein IT208_10580 [Chthonomonadales bacterium]|nr:hypothetical protein [Chthonomonadales bacterium]